MRELTMNEMTAVFGGTEGTWGTGAESPENGSEARSAAL
ncbi:Uncharacterised protein [Neisseria gonorrhoeae]|uniref:Uncharacterized protein n=1 Tax=Neisseria gonorrhoeae TaxID=485 RepID=A0A378W1R6_NEIGO|nr:Uncharacterised protein [Neisseria gonorrhoeae]